MNKRFFVVMAFSAASFAVGAFTAYVHTKRSLDAYYGQQIDLEVARALTIQAESMSDGVMPRVKPKTSDIPRSSERGVEVPEDLRRRDGRIDYHKVARPDSETPGAKPWREGSSDPVVEKSQEAEEGGMPEDIERATLRVIQQENEARREAGLPYVIPQEEAYEDLDGYTNVSFTYYAGDVALATTPGDELQDIESTIGEVNLGKFGYLSEPDIVCVRNDALKIQAEVARSEDSYSVEVEGKKGR